MEETFNSESDKHEAQLLHFTDTGVERLNVYRVLIVIIPMVLEVSHHKTGTQIGCLAEVVVEDAAWVNDNKQE
ncbi:hypothetical protein EYZ11_002549 [Aspergillus tanneri]|uniref:Uncharacterized protein n=1 Tax=Aspergillus tanneri TaxID=1220188 RepID=A0A4S3JQI4_9EURO|nr:hypothetical protein EYZ11_002549 [Aspergillus tanneri]